MTTKTTTFSDQTNKRLQRTRSMGYFYTQTKVEKQESEFDVWKLIKRNNGESPYCLALHYRSNIYPTASRRSHSTTPGATIHRRRKNTDSAMTLDSDGRSSQMSYLNDLHESENFFKENYDFDVVRASIIEPMAHQASFNTLAKAWLFIIDIGEEPEEPPRYPHLVHKPGTYTQELYLKACKRFQIPHSSFFYNHLLNDTILLRRQRLGPIGMKACAIALVETLNVHTLDLTDNNLGPDGARYLAELISENNFLKHLNVSSNALGEEGIHILANVIKKTDSIESLDISNNGLGDRQAEAVRPIIEDTNNLKVLTLSHSELRDEGGKVIGEALLWSDTIQELDLSWNNLRRRGAIKVAEALMKNSSIRTLDLSWNGLHMSGITALGKALEKNTTLTELNISDNRIDKACLEKLCTSLKKNNTLKILKIKRNPLTHEDAVVILYFLQDHPTSGLTFLDLSEISVDENFLWVVEELRKKRELEVHHGKLRGHEMSVQDNEEGLLLKEDSWHVLDELSYVLGFNIVKLLIGICDELRCGLTQDEMVKSLKILKNPLSEKCTEILVKRLPKDHKGFIDFSSKRVSNKRKPSANLRRRLSVIETLQEIGSMIEEDNIENNSEEEPKEKVTVNASQRIRQNLFRVMTRKMCSSSVYRKDVEMMSQNGETMLKYKIIEMLRQDPRS